MPDCLKCQGFCAICCNTQTPNKNINLQPPKTISSWHAQAADPNSRQAPHQPTMKMALRFTFYEANMFSSYQKTDT